MKQLFEFPEDETEAKKQVWKQKFLKYKEILKAKKSVVVAETQKAYEAFHFVVVGNLQTQWDRIVYIMYIKDLWVGVNRSSNKGPCICSWLSFQDCIKRHKLTLFPVDATEIQCFYMQQTVKKP
jgi:hypothetical protein